MLALAVSRWDWLRSHLLVAVVGSAAALGAAGLGTGVAYALVAGSPGDVLRLLAASLVYLPATLVAIGVTVALFGLAPRATGLAWALLGFWLVVGMFGQVLRLPAWVTRLSPYQHVPKLPAASFELLPMVVLAVVAVALAAVGVAGFRARDLSA
jgi:ABC-2 type transport system permease protein